MYLFILPIQKYCQHFCILPIQNYNAKIIVYCQLPIYLCILPISRQLLSQSQLYCMQNVRDRRPTPAAPSAVSAAIAATADTAATAAAVAAAVAAAIAVAVTATVIDSAATADCRFVVNYCLFPLPLPTPDIAAGICRRLATVATVAPPATAGPCSFHQHSGRFFHRCHCCVLSNILTTVQ